MATNFKNHGNELHAQRSYRDAIQAYTSGLDSGPQDQDLRISLLNNRAACNLALRNHGAVLKDVGVIIALTSTRGGLPPVKAMYRAAQSLIALERWELARDCVTRGKGLVQADGKLWKVLEGDVDKGQMREAERAERGRRERLSQKALSRAVEVSSTGHGPCGEADMPSLVVWS